MLRGSAWVTLRRGVYVEASVLARAATHAERRHAVDVAGLLVALDGDGVAGGRSAARIWGLTLVRASSELVVVSADPTVTAHRRGGYTVRKAAVPQRHRRVRHGVPVTSAARTAVDLAREATLVEGVVVVDSVLRAGLASLPQLHDVLGECYCWPGIAQAQRAVRFADPKSESVLESVSRVAMDTEGLPAPRTQVAIGDDRKPHARVDFLWADVKVIGEADGLTKYLPNARQSTGEIVWAEKRREEWLTDAGYEVVRWGWTEANNPPRLARRLRAAFARGAERQRGRRSA